jgi:signal transduction histidine kinase
MVATVAWAWMNLTGGATVPSIADACIVAIAVPGIAVLVATVRGRLTRAEETAVYLDAILVFLLVGTVILAVFGPIALRLPTAASIAAMAYPAAFIGLAGAGLVAMVAIGYSVAPRGTLALIAGSAIIGIAYLGWISASISLTEPGQLTSLCFTAGTLVAAYGVVTWQADRSAGVRYRAVARTATRIVAPTVASILFLLVLAPTSPVIQDPMHIAIFVASIVFTIRQGLLLRERTSTLARLTMLTEENGRLVTELRAELDRRAIDQRRMIQASRAAAVGDLAAGVAHEVNNPLTGVLGFAEILIEDTPVGDPRRADLETIRDEALRARGIVSALRDFANPRAPELVETDLSTHVHQTVDLVRYSIERRGIAIHEDLPALEPILIDGAAIQQAVLNVLTNARQAMDGAGRLDVAVRAEGEGRVVTITDDGVGMDAATARLAFDPFFSGREAPADADRQPSAGLGLSISIGLIESHGGTITIDSAPGRGTTVEIHLPAAEDPGAVDQGKVGMVA